MKSTIILAIVALLFSAIDSSAASLNRRRLGEQLGGWDDRSGRAARFRSQDSNYRLYKPDSTRQPDGGLFVSANLDHIRGMGGDDHAHLQLWFDAAGVLKKSRVKITMGDHSFDTRIITQTGNASLAAGGDPRIAAIANISASVLSKLSRQVSRWNEHGGRANFPSVIEHSLNRIAKNVQ